MKASILCFDWLVSTVVIIRSLPCDVYPSRFVQNLHVGIL